MNVNFTYITSTIDKEPETNEISWNDLCLLLEEQAKIVRHPKDKEYGTPGIFPTVYIDGADSKQIHNVKHYSCWFGVDIDHVMKYDDLKNKLEQLGVPYFIHTTTRHTIEDPHLRGLFMINRNIEIEEFKNVWGSINLLFGGVLDQQTKNINRIFYVPAKWIGSDARYEYKVDGTPLNIDKVMVDFPYIDTDLKLVEKEFVLNKLDKLRKSLVLQDLNIDTSDWRKCRLITNKMVEDLGSGISGGRFFKFMVKVALRAFSLGYPISVGELETLALGADWDANHKKRVNSNHEANRALVYAYSKHIEDEPVKKVEGGDCVEDVDEVEEVKKVVNLKESPSHLSINLFDAECGSGKTWEMLRRINNNGGKWIYACDKISTLNERNEEFRNKICNSNNFYTYTIYSEVDDTDETVGKQINDKLDVINKYDTKNVVIFITHAALFLLDWKDKIDGFNLVIDEANDPIKILYKNYKYNRKTFLKLFSLTDVGDSYEVTPTASGIDLWDSKKFDSVSGSFEGLLSVCSISSNKLWLDKEDWDDEESTWLKFFSVLTPYTIDGFNEVWMLGDEINKSSIVKGWAKVYGINFVNQTFAKRNRTVPLSNRVNIFYFVEHSNASRKYFEGPKNPLKYIVSWIKKNYPNGNYLYTFNDIFKGTLNGLNGQHITPKSHGLNSLQHHTNCFWLACMKVSHPEARLVESLFGMTYDEQVEWREHNALFQFIMRINIRDYHSTLPCNIYVVDKKQAEYIQKRIGGTITCIPGVVPDDKPKAKGGRPIGSKPIKDMTAEELKAYNAAKQQERREKLKNENVKKTLYKGPEESVLLTHPLVNTTPYTINIVNMTHNNGRSDNIGVNLDMEDKNLSERMKRIINLQRGLNE